MDAGSRLLSFVELLRDLTWLLLQYTVYIIVEYITPNPFSRIMSYRSTM